MTPEPSNEYQKLVEAVAGAVLAEWNDERPCHDKCANETAKHCACAKDTAEAALSALKLPHAGDDGWQERYLADRFDWAAPGDQQEDAWLIRFCDKDCGEAIFTGPDAEREAWEHWNRYAPAFNLYVFRLARLTPPAGVSDNG